ncbi:MAG: hypothetical protein JRF27_07290 [Deltaproteobacteria bacterium]|nr:hypothetical protein [Deltaproteobacteria bacterium]MBW2193574.1 hypothetical protein [Deltaproteobacteria bacterium]
MPEKIIAIEELAGPFRLIFQRIMRMVPDRDKEDKKLQRLIAFRLKVDGEDATKIYLIKKIREIIQCSYKGSLYDYLKDDLQQKRCSVEDENPDPPEVA